MNKFSVYFLILFSLFATCSNAQSPPPSSKVLILTGEGLNTTYQDDPSASNFLFTVGSKFAENLTQYLRKMNVSPKLYIKRDKDVSIRKFLIKILNNSNQNGFVQVRVVHIKNHNENSIHLKAEFFPLSRDINAQGGDSYIFNEGISKKYSLTDKSGKNFNKTTPKQMANDFAKLLNRNNFI